MKTKLKYLTKISLKKKICTKWIVVDNIVLALILIGICNIDTIIKSFGGDFDEKKEILVIDNIGCFDELEANFKSSNQYLEDMNDVELVLYDKNINEGKEEVKNDGKELLVIEEDSIIGYLYYSDIYERIEINQIEVDSSYRNKGYGSKLMKYLIDNTNKSITLEVRIDNNPAIALYKKFNFKEVSIRKNYYNGTDGLLMERE